MTVNGLEQGLLKLECVPPTVQTAAQRRQARSNVYVQLI